MNTYKANKFRAIVYDLMLAAIIVVFVMLAMLSPTLGNSHFYSRHINGKENITISLQESIKERIDAIAEETGLFPEAFDFAVGQKKIGAIQKEIINSVFSGNNYDYSDSSGIKNAYYDGITEYYRQYELELDKDALERAVPMACEAFNDVMGIGNTGEMARMITFLSRYSLYGAVAMFVAGAVLAFLIFAFHGGRTKMFSHYGCSLISAGEAMLLIALLDLVVHYSDRLYLTNNFGFNTAFSSASRMYYLIIAVFAAALIIAGFSMHRFVKNYYDKKAKSQKQELDINRSLYVKREDGDDLTIAQIYEDKRKDNFDNGVK